MNQISHQYTFHCNKSNRSQNIFNSTDVFHIVLYSFDSLKSSKEKADVMQNVMNHPLMGDTMNIINTTINHYNLPLQHNNNTSPHSESTEDVSHPDESAPPGHNVQLTPSNLSY